VHAEAQSENHAMHCTCWSQDLGDEVFEDDRHRACANVVLSELYRVFMNTVDGELGESSCGSGTR
jgi:hypothetical protein